MIKQKKMPTLTRTIMSAPMTSSSHIHVGPPPPGYKADPNSWMKHTLNSSSCHCSLRCHTLQRIVRHGRLVCLSRYFVCPCNVGDLPQQRQCQKTESSFVGFVGFVSPESSLGGTESSFVGFDSFVIE
jgi:hypothetical protein